MQFDYTVKPSLGQKLGRFFKNWRLMAFLGFFCVLFGSLGYTIFSEVISNGVHYHGNVAVVNLKTNTLDVIDEETERVVEEAKQRALHVLGENWTSVKETAEALLEHETLSGVALDAVLATVTEVELSDIPLPERVARRGSEA